MNPTAAAIAHWRTLIQRQGEAIETFAETLLRYLALVDRVQTRTSLEFLKGLDEVLPELYLASRRLPSTDDWFDYEEDEADDAPYDRYEVAHQSDLMARYQLIARKLGMADSYAEIFDPHWHLSWTKGLATDREPVFATLSDDLSDILSLGDWLSAYELGGTRDISEAAWHWRFSTDGHIGEHITGAMRAVRSLLYDHDELWEDHDTYWEPLA